MLPNNLKFQYDPTDRNRTKVVLRQDVRALGLTSQGFEILHRDLNVNDSQGESVQIVHGNNLDLVWDDLAFNRVNTFVAHSSLVPSAAAYVTDIRRERRWESWATVLPPDQNTPRADCLQFEASSFRHLWPIANLEAFLIQNGQRLAFQFKGNHTYILSPSQAQFAMIRDQILDENLSNGCCNLFTVFDNSWYVDAPPPRIFCQAVVHKRENMAARGDWNVIMDLRWSPSPRQINRSLPVALDL